MADAGNDSNPIQIDDVLLFGFGAVGVICRLHLLSHPNACELNTFPSCFRCSNTKQKSEHTDYSYCTREL